MLLFKFIPKPEFTKNIPIQLKPTIFSHVLKYNFPYVLWFLSGIFLMRFIWFYNINSQKIYILMLYGICFIYVICKYFNNFPGTFDWLDLILMSIGAFVEGLLYNNFSKRRII